jgi:hypothetical protein
MFWITIFVIMLFATSEVKSATKKGYYHCVRINKVREEIIDNSVILKVDYKPIKCPSHFHLDRQTEQQGYQSLEEDTAIFNQTNVNFDPKYFQEGTEIAILVNTNLARSKRFVALAPLFYSFGSFLFAAISVWIIQTSTTNLSPVHVSHRIEEDNYLEQLRQQKLRDAEYEDKKALQIAQSMDPNQVAPAKKTGKQGEWCTAIQTKTISLDNKSGSGRQSARGGGPGGSGPTPPPTPNWSKGTPAPRIVTENPRKRKKNKPFIQDPKRARSNSVVVEAVIHPDLEVEVITLDDSDDDVIVIEQTETIIQGKPGRTLIASSRICQEEGQYNDFRETEVAVIDMAPEITLSDSPLQSPRQKHQQVYSQVIANLPAVRTRIISASTTSPYEVARQWRGNRWGSNSDPIENTCVIDSFLSHTIYLARRNPDYFNQVLRLVNDRAEVAIRNVIRTANSNDYSHRQRSNLIHEHWVSAFPEVFTQRSGRHVNIASSEMHATLLQLTNSSQIWIAHQCNCAGAESVMLPLNRNSGTLWTAQTIGWFQSRTFPANTANFETMECDVCLTRQRPVRGFVSESTWFHSFRIGEDDIDQDPSVFDFNSYPQTIVFEELVTGNTVYFDIGYFTLVTPFRVTRTWDKAQGRFTSQTNMQHVTSVHFVEGIGWRYYDGMDFSSAGGLQNVPNFTPDSQRVIRVTYFRRYVHRQDKDL